MPDPGTRTLNAHHVEYDLPRFHSIVDDDDRMTVRSLFHPTISEKVKHIEVRTPSFDQPVSRWLLRKRRRYAT
jgi:hypothetical protein